MNAFGKKVLALYRTCIPKKEIARRLGCTPSVVSYWTNRYGDLSIRQLHRLDKVRRQHQAEARARGTIAIREKWGNYKRRVIGDAKATYENFRLDPLFCLGLGLYLGEGDKTLSVGMTNLDLNILRIFVLWCKKYLGGKSFTAYLQTFKTKNYHQLCKEIDEKLMVRCKWGEKPIRPLGKYSSRMYKRSYGTVRVVATGLKMASLVVNTWMESAKNA